MGWNPIGEHCCVCLSWAKMYFFSNSTKWFIILMPRWSPTGKTNKQKNKRKKNRSSDETSITQFSPATQMSFGTKPQKHKLNLQTKTLNPPPLPPPPHGICGLLHVSPRLGCNWLVYSEDRMKPGQLLRTTWADPLLFASWYSFPSAIDNTHFWSFSAALIPSLDVWNLKQNVKE